MTKDLLSKLQLISEENLLEIERAKVNPAPLSGSQLLEFLFKVGFLVGKEKRIALMQEVTAEVKSGAFRSEHLRKARTKRILLTGVPVGLGSDKVVKIAEQVGADVVAFENCSGYKQAFFVNENEDPMEALAKQYLATPCSVMSPNNRRLELLKEMIQAFSVDGVIDLTWQACHTYNVEAYRVNEFIQETFDFPTLHLETDYAESDTEQLRVRIEAYLEML